MRIEKAQNTFKEEITRKFDEVIGMIQGISTNPEKCGLKFATKDSVARAWDSITDHEARIRFLEQRGKNGQ